MILAGIGVSPTRAGAKRGRPPTRASWPTTTWWPRRTSGWPVTSPSPERDHDRRIRIEHWDVALNHGSYIGKSWAGAEDGPYQVVPYFFSDIGDWTWME